MLGSSGCISMSSRAQKIVAAKRMAYFRCSSMRAPQSDLTAGRGGHNSLLPVAQFPGEFHRRTDEKEEKANPALDSSPSSWVRSNPQFNAGEVSRARLYAETLVSLDFNRSQVSVSRWQRRPAPELSPPCRRLQPREVAWSHSYWDPLRSTRNRC